MKTKRYILLFPILLLVTINSFAQSKKDIETSLKICASSKDSISTINLKLNLQLDSLKRVITNYDTMYNAIKTKVVLKDFNPVQMESIIDSIRSGGTKNEFGTLITVNDSISLLRLDNKRLNETIKAMNSAVSERTVVIYDLRQLKQLLDENIITQLEFNEKKIKLLEKL